MSFDWLCLLELARRLHVATVAARNQDPPTLFGESISLAEYEACCRAIASRAYYAVYNMAAAEVRRIDGFTVSDQSGRHSALFCYLQDSRRPCWRKMGDQLKSLYQLRCMADYWVELRLRRQPIRPGNLASDAISRAERIASDFASAFPQ